MTLTKYFSRVRQAAVGLTEEQELEAWNAVISAYDNIGSVDYTDPDDYETARLAIEQAIFERGRPEPDEVLKAIYDEAISHLDSDFESNYRP